MRCAVRAALVAVITVSAAGPAFSQSSVPTAELFAASRIQLTGEVDSNSPAVWDVVGGQSRLFVVTSTGGEPSVATGRRLSQLGTPRHVGFVSHPGNGVWMEGVVRDDGGTWYGYYHNEIPATVCGRPDRVLPRIGAARSRDQGQTWEDLGIVLEAPPGWYACDTPNRYFVGGVGDVSVALDHDSQELYFFFSQYSKLPQAQGVAVARMLWAYRDAPVGRVDVWANGAWQPPSVADDIDGTPTWEYPPGTPLVPVSRPWHDADPVDDAFWGASVHWNEYLQQYVMLLNRTADEEFGQQGIYIAYAPRLDDPSLWSPPKLLLEGGRWYPQVIGVEPNRGTDKDAGSFARFFMGGLSDYVIQFAKGSP